MAPGGVRKSKKKLIKLQQSSLDFGSLRSSFESSTLTNIRENFGRVNSTTTEGLSNSENVASMPSVTPTSNHLLDGRQHMHRTESLIDDPSSQATESSDLPSTETSAISGIGSKKRGRGKTMGKGVMQTVVASGNKIKITVDPKIGRPLNGDESAKLASQIGIVTRDVLPVPKKWKDVDVKKDLDPGLDHLNIHLDVNMADAGVRDSLIDRLQISTRQKRYRLHMHFKKFDSLEEAKRNKPDFIANQANWEALCDHYSTPKFKHISTINSENRNQVKAPHISGRKPFTVRRHEISQKELNGEPCDRIELYKRTHYSDRNGWSSPGAEENWNAMIEKQNQYNQEEGNLKTSEEIVQEVLGRGSGYIKGLGYGPKPPSIRRLSTDLATQQLQNNLLETQQKLETSESQVKELTIQVNEFDTEVTTLKDQLSQQGATINKLMEIMVANGMNLS